MFIISFALFVLFFTPSNAHHAHAHHIIAWVTRPERPKGAKDEVKLAWTEGPPTRSWGPEGL